MNPAQRNPEDRPMAALLAPDILALLEDSPRDIAAETEELHPADLADVVEVVTVGNNAIFIVDERFLQRGEMVAAPPQREVA